MRAYVLIFVGLCFFAGQNSADQVSSDISDSLLADDELQYNAEDSLYDLPYGIENSLPIEYGVEPNCESIYETLPPLPNNTLYREPYNETPETKKVPSLVFITKSESIPECGGNIIAKYWILAPANCVCNSSNGKWNPTVNRVTAGSNDYSEPKFTYEIDNVICHPHYGQVRLVGNSIYENNVALIKLKENVKWGSDLKAIFIDATPINQELVKTSAVIRFWGSECYIGGPLLQKTERMVMSMEDCKKAWEENFSVPFRGNTLCLKKKSSCAGRLQSGATELDILIGIPSTEMTWCVNNVVFYTSISYHQHWIGHHVKNVKFMIKKRKIQRKHN